MCLITYIASFFYFFTIYLLFGISRREFSLYYIIFSVILSILSVFVSIEIIIHSKTIVHIESIVFNKFFLYL